MTIPKFIKFFSFLIINFALLFFYKTVLKQPLRIVETIIITAIGSLFCFSLFSIIKSPRQFFEALKQRIVRPFALFFAISIRLLGFLLSLSLRALKLSIALAIIILYDASPIDLIPDIILGVGWLDDIAVTLLLLYWGLTFGRIAMAGSLREFSKGLNEATKITTNFP